MLVLLDLVALGAHGLSRRGDPGELVLHSQPVAVELPDAGRDDLIGTQHAARLSPAARSVTKPVTHSPPGLVQLKRWRRPDS